MASRSLVPASAPQHVYLAAYAKILTHFLPIASTLVMITNYADKAPVRFCAWCWNIICNIHATTLTSMTGLWTVKDKIFASNAFILPLKNFSFYRFPALVIITNVLFVELISEIRVVTFLIFHNSALFVRIHSYFRFKKYILFPRLRELYVRPRLLSLFHFRF